MKGMSTLIATILLLLITIAVTGLASLFFSRITGTIGQAVEDQTARQLHALSKQVSIDNANMTAVTLRNVGSSTVLGSEIGVYVNGALTGCSPQLSSIAPGSLQTCNFLPACAAGQKIRVTSPGSAAETSC